MNQESLPGKGTASEKMSDRRRLYVRTGVAGGNGRSDPRRRRRQGWRGDDRLGINSSFASLGARAEASLVLLTLDLGFRICIVRCGGGFGFGLAGFRLLPFCFLDLFCGFGVLPL